MVDVLVAKGLVVGRQVDETHAIRITRPKVRLRNAAHIAKRQFADVHSSRNVHIITYADGRYSSDGS